MPAWRPCPRTNSARLRRSKKERPLSQNPKRQRNLLPLNRIDAHNLLTHMTCDGSIIAGTGAGVGNLFRRSVEVRELPRNKFRAPPTFAEVLHSLTRRSYSFGPFSPINLLN